MMKTVVWFLGSNGTGKTTQTKSLLNVLGNKNNIEIITGKEEDTEFKYTKYGNVSALGIISDRDCCGCDTLSTKAMIRLSYLKAIEDTDIVFIDGIMSTNTWIEFIREREVKVLVVHFKISLEENLLRVLQRRNQTLEEMGDDRFMKLHDNLKGKIKGFQSSFNKQISNCDSNLEILATEDKDKITTKIIEEITKFYE